MTTIARQASLRIADRTAPLAQLVINAKFAAIVEALITEADKHEHTCQMCTEPAAYLFTRLTEDGDEIEACETCVDTYRLAYAAN